MTSPNSSGNACEHRNQLHTHGGVHVCADCNADIDLSAVRRTAITERVPVLAEVYAKPVLELIERIRTWRDPRDGKPLCLDDALDELRGSILRQLLSRGEP